MESGKWWKVILLIKKRVELQASFLTSFQLTFNFDNDTIEYTASIEAQELQEGLGSTILGRYNTRLEKFDFEFYGALKLNKACIEFFDLYLPYCFLKPLAIKKKRAVSVSHFAQTLDGKIATSEGCSQWIGNEENLVHAHRMRALCDGILIGATTNVNDEPSLTLRLVDGEQPVKILLGNTNSNLTKLNCDGKLIHINDKLLKEEANLKYYEEGSSEICCESVLGYLFHRGISGVYIEGGAKTTSVFLNRNLLDVVQVHIAPIILGSGITGFQFPGSNSIEDGMRFENFKFFPMGNEVMMIGSKVE